MNGQQLPTDVKDKDQSDRYENFGKGCTYPYLKPSKIELHSFSSQMLTYRMMTNFMDIVI